MLNFVKQKTGFQKKPNEHDFIIPGTCIEILGQGVLLRGDSGTGKSLLSLELIRHGHKLVADDAVSVDAKNSKIFVKCPPRIQNFMYLKELGIINVREMFGPLAICLQTELKLVIQLSTTMEKQTPCLSDLYTTDSILNVDVPMLIMPTPTYSILIETAVRGLLLKNKGYTAFNQFNHQQSMSSFKEERS